MAKKPLAAAAEKKAKSKKVEAKAEPARKATSQPREVVGFWGFSDSSVIRWMGKHGFTASDARNVFEAIGRPVNAVTLTAELSHGRTGWGKKRLAPLTEAQGKKLLQLKESH